MTQPWAWARKHPQQIKRGASSTEWESLRKHPRNLPSAETRAINTELRATHWKYQKLGNISYLEISYAASLGNTSENEAKEYYDLDLNPITDRSLVFNIIQNAKRNHKGSSGQSRTHKLLRLIVLPYQPSRP